MGSISQLCHGTDPQWKLPCDYHMQPCSASQEKELEAFQRRATRMIKYKEYFPCEQKVDSLFSLQKK